MEDEHINHTPQKKSISVLARVKEKAKKWRHSLSSNSFRKKQHSHDGNATPSWGVSLDDEDDDNPQHLPAPMYEPEMGPQARYKQTSTQHPKTILVASDRSHVVPTSASTSINDLVGPSVEDNNINDVQASSTPPKSSHIKHVQVSPTPMAGDDVQATPSLKPNNGVQANHSPKILQHHQGVYPRSAPVRGASPKGSKTISKTMVEKLGPAYTTVSDDTLVLASKLQNLAFSNHETLRPESETPQSAPAKATLSPTVKSSHRAMANTKEGDVIAPALPAIETKQTQLGDKKTSPDSAPAAIGASGYPPSASNQLWDKGVSVKEYIMQKLEPGEDEKALSQVISKAISPNKNDDDSTVVEKVREAVTSLLQNQQQSSSQPNRPAFQSAYHSAQNSSSQFPSVSDEDTEAETLERLLQTN